MEMKPTGVQQLLDDLKGESFRHSAEVGRDGKAVVYVNAEDEVGITFTAEEAKLILDSPDTVDRLVDALTDADEPSICLFDITVSDDVRDALERMFTAVDEG